MRTFLTPVKYFSPSLDHVRIDIAQREADGTNRSPSTAKINRTAPENPIHRFPGHGKSGPRRSTMDP